MESQQSQQVSMEDIVSLAKRRGFIFPGSELYGGLAGTYDYGPLGVYLVDNIKQSWMQKFVTGRTDMYPVNAAILMNPRVWETTGHVDEFHDPLLEDLKTHKRYRADHILEAAGIADAEALTPEEMTVKIKELGLVSPDGNAYGDVKQFNMMLKTKVGASEDSASISYLRPETAQGIFVNYKNVVDTIHPKIPFGISQIGKAFRNEITPRDFVFRVRELEQMEIEYFIHPDDWEAQFEYWKDEQLEWFTEIGIATSLVSEYEHPEEGRSHYSKRTIDWEFKYPFGSKELCGLAYRTDFDLMRHGEATKTKLQYTDPKTNETYVPHVIEPSFGVERTVLAVLLSAYKTDIVGDEPRTYLDFRPNIAPYKIAVSPLLKNKPDLVGLAREVFAELKQEFGNVVFDDNGNIGKRYRRQDEIGTPCCVVIDFESLEDGTVTVRDRNTTEQVRIGKEDLVSWCQEKFSV